MPDSAVRLKTTGMHCGSCSMLIKLTLEDLPGVSSVNADHATGITDVTYDPAQVEVGKIVDTIVEAGYGAEVMG